MNKREKPQIFLPNKITKMCLCKRQLGVPHSSVGSVQDLRTGGRLSDPWLGQYSFREIMIVIAAGFIPLSLLSIISTMVMWESSQ